MTFGAYLKAIRENANFSQDFVSQEIGISRPTYMQVEKGDRELTITEAKKLSELFNLSLEQFLAQGKPQKHVIQLEKPRKKFGNKPEVRISIPRLQKEKFKAVLLYILEKVGAKPNIGETVLCKLLYFIDFDFYEKFERQLTGATYIRNHYGPSPLEFTQLINEMRMEGELEPVSSSYFQYHQKKYLPKKSADLTLLNAQELAHIEEVLNRLSDKSASEMTNYSHSDIPWKIHQPGEKIDYESVFYRDQEHSVRNYDDEL